MKPAATIGTAFRRGLRTLVRRTVASDLGWRISGGIAGRSEYLRVQRGSVLEQRFEEKCARFFSARTVLGGPFAGLRYPCFASFGSALFPKLLGTYEAELHPALARLGARAYTDLIDVGFAEGYYLVGLAKKIPRARAWGFDISPAAHELCVDLAAANQLSPQRLRLAAHASPGHLAAALQGRSLVVLDCEGFERELIAHDTVARWRQSDLLVECHDFLRPDTASTLAELLRPTHEITVIATKSTAEKVGDAPEAARAVFSSSELFRLVDEGRPSAQSWIVAEARSPFSTRPS